MSAGCGSCPRSSGPAKAAELLFTGDMIDAQEALRIGLVSEVVPHAELMPRATALAERIAANPPLALRYMKEGLRRGTYGDPTKIGGWAIDTIYRCSRPKTIAKACARFSKSARRISRDGKNTITRPWGGSKLSLSVSEKRISGRGIVDAAPRPEKFFASLRFFDPPSRGGWNRNSYHLRGNVWPGNENT
jgi:hypothetical protein